MSAYLHWLDWDLRRFRGPLLFWVALLTGLTAWVLYVKIHPLPMTSVVAFSISAPLPSLYLVQITALIGILNSDPAAGTGSFWKTRPPSGFTIAAARLTLVGFFFFLLPILYCWIVSVLTAPSGEGYSHVKFFSNRITLTEYLWWLQCLTLSPLILTAAASSGTGQAVVRLLTGGGVVLAAMYAVMILADEENFSHAVGVRKMAKGVMYAACTSEAAALWLVQATVVFFMGRCTRTPVRALRWIHLLLPLFMLLEGAFLFSWYGRSGSLWGRSARGIQEGNGLSVSGISIFRRP